MPDDLQEKDWLDAMLAAEPEYIHDDGFTSQVVAALPAKHRRGFVTRRVILGFAIAFAVVMGLMAFPQGQEIGVWARIATNSAVASPALAMAIIFAAGLAVISASVFWVLREE